MDIAFNSERYVPRNERLREFRTFIPMTFQVGGGRAGEGDERRRPHHRRLLPHHVLLHHLLPRPGQQSQHIHGEWALISSLD